MNISIQDVTSVVGAISLAWMAFDQMRIKHALRNLGQELDTAFDDVYTALSDIGDTVADQHCECCTFEDEYPVDTSALESVEDSFARYVGALPPPADAWIDYDGSTDALRLANATKMLREAITKREAERKVREANESATILDARMALVDWHEGRRS